MWMNHLYSSVTWQLSLSLSFHFSLDISPPPHQFLSLYRSNKEQKCCNCVHKMEIQLLLTSMLHVWEIFVFTAECEEWMWCDGNSNFFSSE